MRAGGAPSVPPEQLLSALLIQVFYGIRSERQLMEQLNYNFLYRWFVGLSPDDLVWDQTTFTKNRDRLRDGGVFEKFMTKLLSHPEVKPLLSDEHFSVDGTLIEAWASQKSFRPKDDGGEDDGTNFHGQKRTNDAMRLSRKSAVTLAMPRCFVLRIVPCCLPVLVTLLFFATCAVTLAARSMAT
jgi:transposase